METFNTHRGAEGGGHIQWNIRPQADAGWSWIDSLLQSLIFKSNSTCVDISLTLELPLNSFKPNSLHHIVSTWTLLQSFLFSFFLSCLVAFTYSITYATSFRKIFFLFSHFLFFFLLLPSFLPFFFFLLLSFFVNLELWQASQYLLSFIFNVIFLKFWSIQFSNSVVWFFYIFHQLNHSYHVLRNQSYTAIPLQDPRMIACPTCICGNLVLNLKITGFFSQVDPSNKVKQKGGGGKTTV